MSAYVVVVTISSLLISFVLGSNGNVNLTLYENDVCNSYGWTCQRAPNCTYAVEAIKRGEKPEICSFDGSQPIVCCPRSNTQTTTEVSKPLTESKSQAMCSTYTARICIPPPPVVGGEPARSKEFPHMALIGYGEDPDNILWQCGGSLISERYVLSAAHCSFPSSTVGFAKYVRIGDLNTDSDTDYARPQQFNIIQLINHPGYKPPELYNDIALYKLDVNATFNDYVRPLCLYQSYSLPDGAGVATGWGRLEFAGPLSKNLMKVNLNYIQSNECSRLLTSPSQLPRGIDSDSMVCAGERDGSRDTCQGDSGGPLAVQRNLQSSCLASQVGITSFGRQCGLPNSPGVYTRVAHYTPWIESIVWPESV